MVFNIGSRSHAGGEFGNVDSAPGFLQSAVGAQLLRNGEQVDRLLLDTQIANSSIYQLVGSQIKTFLPAAKFPVSYC